MDVWKGVNEPKMEDRRRMRCMYGEGIRFEMDSMKINDRSGRRLLLRGSTRAEHRV